MKYKYLIFDLDDTLNNDDENRKHAFAEVLRELKMEVTDKAINDFLILDTEYWRNRANSNSEDVNQFNTLEEKIEYMRAKRFLLYFKNINIDEAKKINNCYLKKLKENIVPIDGAKDTVKKLYENGYKIAVATNGPVIAIGGKLEKIGIDNYIDCIFSAEEVRIYEAKRGIF